MCRSCGCQQSRARGLCHRCYTATRKAALKAGTWNPQVREVVDGGEASAHLDALTAAGISRWQVVRITGLHHQTVYHIQPGRNVDAETAAQILRVPLAQVPHALLDGKAFVPAVGTTRRLQALCALGWPVKVLAQRLGDVHPGHLGEVCRGDRYLVMAYTARAVDALYEKLSGTPGPSERVRVVARRRGWAPPLAWAQDEVPERCSGCTLMQHLVEGNHIDDPNARPAHLRSAKPSFAERYADAVELGYTDPIDIAQRLGIDERSLARQLAPSRQKRRQHA